MKLSNGRLAIWLSVICVFGVLSGCGGQSLEFVDAPAEGVGNTSVQPEMTVEEARLAREFAVFLQSGVWATECENRQIKTLDFSPVQLTTEIQYFKDDLCEEPRDNMQRIVEELYAVGGLRTDESGVQANSIHFWTVLSDKHDLALFENNRLYLGRSNGDASFTATAIDFGMPYQRD